MRAIVHGRLLVCSVIQVTAKRTNRPGISTTNRGRGRGRGRGMRGGGFNPYFGGMMMMPMQPMYYRGGRGRAFRYVHVCGHMTD